MEQDLKVQSSMDSTRVQATKKVRLNQDLCFSYQAYVIEEYDGYICKKKLSDPSDKYYYSLSL